MLLGRILVKVDWQRTAYWGIPRRENGPTVCFLNVLNVYLVTHQVLPTGHSGEHVSAYTWPAYRPKILYIHENKNYYTITRQDIYYKL